MGGCQLRSRKSEILGQGGNKYIKVTSKNLIKELSGVKTITYLKLLLFIYLETFLVAEMNFAIARTINN